MVIIELQIKGEENNRSPMGPQGNKFSIKGKRAPNKPIIRCSSISLELPSLKRCEERAFPGENGNRVRMPGTSKSSEAMGKRLVLSFEAEKSVISKKGGKKGRRGQLAVSETSREFFAVEGRRGKEDLS